MNNVAIKDGRAGFYMVQNAVLDEYGARMGPFGIALYNALCRFAGRDHTAHPSLKRLAEITGMSRRAVVTHLQRLADLGLVSVEQRTAEAGDADTNLYTILDPGGVVQEMHHVVHQAHEGGAGDALGVVQEMHPNNTYKNNTQLPRQSGVVMGVVDDADLAVLCTHWRDNMPQRLTPILRQQLRQYADRYGPPQVTEAIAIALSNGKPNMAYVGGILEKRAAGASQANGYSGAQLVPLEDER